jgi:hypothetical protein
MIVLERILMCYIPTHWIYWKSPGILGNAGHSNTCDLHYCLLLKVRHINKVCRPTTQHMLYVFNVINILLRKAVHPLVSHYSKQPNIYKFSFCLEQNTVSHDVGRTSLVLCFNGLHHFRWQMTWKKPAWFFEQTMQISRRHYLRVILVEINF